MYDSANLPAWAKPRIVKRNGAWRVLGETTRDNVAAMTAAMRFAVRRNEPVAVNRSVPMPRPADGLRTGFNAFGDRL